MSDCIFCDISNRKVDPALTVYADDDVFAQVSLHQKSANIGHTLVIPREHVRNLFDAPVALDAPIMSAIRLLSSAVKIAFAADGIQVRQNNEPAAGQDVFHLHFHIIPRYHGDGFESSKYVKLTIEERIDIAAKLKAVLTQIDRMT
jgi:histidine triad (HIT) family protein